MYAIFPSLCSCFYYCLCNALLFSTILFFFCHLQWYQWYWLNLLLWDLIITSKKMSTYQTHCKIRQFHIHALSLVKAGLFGMVSYWAFFLLFQGKVLKLSTILFEFCGLIFPFPYSLSLCLFFLLYTILCCYSTVLLLNEKCGNIEFGSFIP